MDPEHKDPEHKDPSVKTPLTGISGRESVFDKRLREFRTSGTFQKPDRKVLNYIKNTSSEFAIPSLDSKLHAKATDLETHTETERLAFLDELSGFLNARTVLTKLATELRRSARYKRKVSLLCIELDHIKDADTRLTPLGADMLFIAYCNTVKSNIREVDIIGRFDEHTLLVVCPETGFIDAITEAERLRNIIAAASFKPVGQVLSLTSSIGVATYPQHGNAAIEILGSALEAAQHAVSQGGNIVCSPRSAEAEKQEVILEDFTPGEQPVDDKAVFESKCDVYNGQLGAEMPIHPGIIPTSNPIIP